MKVGTKVQVSINIPMDGGKNGVVIAKKDVKTDGHGIPKITGHYKPMAKNEVAVRLDNGKVQTFLESYLIPLSDTQRIEKNCLN